MTSTPLWDSLKHVQLLSAVERKFGIEIDGDDARTVKGTGFKFHEYTGKALLKGCADDSCLTIKLRKSEGTFFFFSVSQKRVNALFRLLVIPPAEEIDQCCKVTS